MNRTHVRVERLLDARARVARGELTELRPAKRAVVTHRVVLLANEVNLVLTHGGVQEDVEDTEVGVQLVDHDTGLLASARPQTLSTREEAGNLPLRPGAYYQRLRHLVAAHFVEEELHDVVDVGAHHRGAGQVCYLGAVG